jgi:hypothetical protein
MFIAGMHFLGYAGYYLFRHPISPFDEEDAMNDPKKRRNNYKHSQNKLPLSPLSVPSVF